MLKFNLVLALLFVHISAYATDYYEIVDNSFPELQQVTKVYMGDAMLIQKYEYSEQCYTPKKSFTLSKEDAVVKNEPVREAVCLKSSEAIEKKSRKGIRQITKGGTMCRPDPDGKYFYPKDFYSFKKVDGSDQRKNFFMLVRKKGKVGIWQEEFGRLIKMTDEEFEETFTRFEVFEKLPASAPWRTLVRFKKGIQICKSIGKEDSGIFYGVDVSITKTLPTETLSKDVESFSIVPSEIGIDINVNTSPMTDVLYNLDLSHVMENEFNSIGITDEGNKTWNFSKAEFDNSFTESSKLVQQENSLQRTIEYAGVNGNLVKFIYTEFQNGMARHSYTREFTIDLTQSNTGAYKGAVFEVIKATNSTIEYKIIRGFR